MRKQLFILLPLILFSTGFGREGEKDTTAILKASYLYNIAKLIEWKDPSHKEGKFVIGIMSESNIYQELVKKYSNKSIGKQPIEIRKMSRSANIGKSHILYVPRSAHDLMPDIYKNTKGTGTLVVTDYPGALSEGSTLNFIVVNKTLNFELNIPNAKAQGLQVAATLKQLAHRVEGQ
jgi:hypothetical protein